MSNLLVELQIEVADKKRGDVEVIIPIKSSEQFHEVRERYKNNDTHDFYLSLIESHTGVCIDEIMISGWGIPLRINRGRCEANVASKCENITKQRAA